MVNNKFWEFSIVELIGSIISAASLVISAFTLFIAYKLFKNFDAKKLHVNKQLETVLNLVETINKTIITVSFKNKIPKHILEKVGNIAPGQASLSAYSHSLFYISRLGNSNQKYEHVMLDANTDVITVLPFLNFINNPLLPTSISKKLAVFYSPIRNFRHFDQVSDGFVVLGSFGKDDMYGYPDFVPAFKDWDGFIKCAAELKTEINSWLKKYGAVDINFNETLQSPNMK